MLVSFPYTTSTGDERFQEHRTLVQKVCSRVVSYIFKGKKGKEGDLPHLAGHPEGEGKRALPYSR
jgi:hypothetical protein